MNERIQQLAIQVIGDYSYGDYWPFFEEELEKFTELIVEEFRGVLSEEYRKTPLECCGHFLRADEAITKHFYGIK